jgi:bacteriocin biosynthesis cyclodehydratase domain-containing protein
MPTERTTRLRPAQPVTIIALDDHVHLICGEDIRYTIRAEGLATPLADLLTKCDGCTPLDRLLDGFGDDGQARVRDIIDRLCGERLLIDGPVEAATPFGRHRLEVSGSGPLVERLRCPAADLPPVAVLCQDTLDYRAAMDFNRLCLTLRTSPWLWVSTGPASRGYVSPLFLPDAGPCLACLLRHFQRLSPVPYLYDALMHHSEQGGPFAPAGFPDGGLTILEQVVRWKVDRLGEDPTAASVFRLHVLELETMELSVHRVFRDPTCPECHDASPE